MFKITNISPEKLLNSIKTSIHFVQIWPKVPMVTVATEVKIKIRTFYLFLSGNDHSTKVSSNSEMVRGTAVWELVGALRELEFKRLAKFVADDILFFFHKK